MAGLFAWMKQERVAALEEVSVQARVAADSVDPGGEGVVVTPEVRAKGLKSLWFILFAVSSPILILLFLLYFY